MTTVADLNTALSGSTADPAWLEAALSRVVAEPGAIVELFPAAGRRCGRHALPGVPGWTADDAGRALLLAALPGRDDESAAEISELYRYGDAAEKRAVLHALPLLPLGPEAVPLLADALRTNDPRLVAAALGPYAAHLDDAAWRQAVLKCVFMEIPLSAVHGLADRADAKLAVMLAGFAAERRAAGRSIPADAEALLDKLTTAPNALAG